MLGETQVVHNLPKEIQDFKNTERRIVANPRNFNPFFPIVCPYLNL